MTNWKFAAYLAVAVAVGLILREYVRALTADRLGDPNPRRWGRVTLDPRPMVDPFGSLILPALLLVLVGSGNPLFPVFAYAKPLPLDPSSLKRPDRDTTLISIAGPVSNLVLSAAAGLLLRLGLGGEVGVLVYAFLYVNLILFVFHLMPVPGLDGARILARYLPTRARQIYMNMDQYLILFILVIFFLLGAPILTVVDALAGAVCDVLAGNLNCF